MPGPGRVTKFNRQTLNVQFQKQVWNTPFGRNFAKGMAQRRTNVAQNQMMKAFESDEVTIELESGGEVGNISETITYFHPQGRPNLFSFIGFPAGSNPVEELRNLLDGPIDIQLKTFRKDKNTYVFKVALPSVKDIERVTPMPEWNKGGSWARQIEDGTVSGIGRYLTISAGRSGGGIEHKSGDFDSSFTGREYITKIIDTFREALSRQSSF